MTKNKIGVREFIAIVVIAVVSKIADDTPSNLFEHTGTAGWMVPLLGGLFAIIPISLLIWIINQYENLNIFEIIYDLFGRWIGSLIIFILWFSASMYMIYDSSVHKDIISTMYYFDSSKLIIYLIFILVCSFGAYKGVLSIGSVAWITLPFLAIFLNSSFILAIDEVQPSFLFPVFGHGPLDILKTSLLHYGMVSDIFFFFVFVNLLPSKKDFVKSIWISFVLIIIGFTGSMMIFEMIFDFEKIHFVNYPFHELIRFISLGFVTNTEALYFPFWLIATFIRYSIYFYICVYILGELLNIKKFHRLIPIYALLFVLIGSTTHNTSFILTQIKKINTYVFSVLFILIPFVMCLRLIYVRRKEKCNESIS